MHRNNSFMLPFFCCQCTHTLICHVHIYSEWRSRLHPCCHRGDNCFCSTVDSTVVGVGVGCMMLSLSWAFSTSNIYVKMDSNTLLFFPTSVKPAHEQICMQYRACSCDSSHCCTVLIIVVVYFLHMNIDFHTTGEQGCGDDPPLGPPNALAHWSTFKTLFLSVSLVSWCQSWPKHLPEFELLCSAAYSSLNNLI